jgi:UDP-N-acetylmuramoyl-L-alanyl-D-glutamate--2,6-diaminopimelate ligase
MMLLRELLAPWLDYEGDEVIGDMTLDSRAVNNTSLFVAIPGHRLDGREFVGKALASGAVAALCHTDDATLHGHIKRHDAGVEISVYDLSSQLSALAAQRYPLSPAKKMSIIGVTGTNGKTSVSQLIAQMTQLLGMQAAVMGTLGNGLWGGLHDSGNTTADAITLMRQLNDFEGRGVRVCAMEVSSHGLVQGRVEAVPFEIAVFTNLSRDHLDYHGDMQSYGAAKRGLFEFDCLSHRLLNLDDETGALWHGQMTDEQVLGLSIEGHPKAAFSTSDAQYHDHGVSATLVWPQGEARIDSPLLGAFNLSNLLAAIAALYLQGQDMQRLLAIVPRLTPVAGRMECFVTAKGVTLVVDYAHTPDALEQALKALRRHCAGELWCLFGCGGDRDKGKRPLMARAAEAFADRLMITSDNARSEQPADIIADILTGLSRPEAALTQVDRVQAIQTLVALARPGDIILLAGKGHETYQEVAGVRHEYDERALARQLAEVQP